MASASVMAAVRARLASGWSHCPVVYPNEEEQVPASAPAWLAVQYPVATEDQITVGAPGANVFREEGAIRFVLFIPRGAGVDDFAAWMDDLRALFRARQFSGVTTYAASPPVLDDRADAGKHWALSCAVPYQADLFA